MCSHRRGKTGRLRISRLNLSALGTGPLAQQAHYHPHRGEHTREQLAGRLRPNPPQVASKAAEGAAGPGRREGGPPTPPRLGTAALHEALGEAECPPGARHAPLCWLRPLPSHDSGGRGQGPFPGREPSQPDSSLRCLAARSSTLPLEAQEAEISQGRWQEGGSALTEGDDLAACC